MSKKLLLLAILLVFTAANSFAVSIDMKISGPGAVNDSTIKVGEKVSFDLYFVNKAAYRGFSLGFKFTSPDIKKVTHVVEKGLGVNKNGDIKAFNGWNDITVWDFSGLLSVETNWDGELPDIIGFGGVCKNKEYKPHSRAKNISIEMIIDETGTIVVDSSFFPPSGKWMFSPPSVTPEWGGPYQFKVVK